MEKKLKIGLFIDTFFPMIDGVIMVVDNYARRLAKTCDVTVFAPEGRSEHDDSKLPYKVVRCKSNFPVVFLDYDLPMPSLDAEFKKELKNADLDIVHIHSPFTIGKIGVKYAKQHNIPVVATMHSQFKQDFFKATKSKIITNVMLKNIMKVFNSCDECWAVNKKIAEVFVEYGAKELPKVQNNGTDLRPIEGLKQVAELKKKYDIKEDEKVLLFIGRLTALKNIFFTVDSLKILKEKNFKFKMLFVGAGQDEDKLKSQIKKYKLQDDVILAGRVSGRELISNYYKMADLFLFPSLYDASSLVQIEAASQGTPTVFLKGAATADTVTDDVNGYLSENDPEKFAEKIIEIFSDEVKFDKIKKNAVKELYINWDDVVAKVYGDYLRLIKIKKN